MASLASTAAAFLVGNLFGWAFLLLLLVIYAWQHVKLYFCIALLAYYAFTILSKAHTKPTLVKEAGWIARGVMDYFQMELKHGASDFQENDRYIFAASPHGIHGFGMFPLLYSTAQSSFFQKYPFMKGRIVGVVADVLFKIPIVREMMLSAGFRDVNKRTLVSCIQQGFHPMIIIGGEAESLLSKPGTDLAVVEGKKRKGFVRLALETKAKVVPVYFFRNTDTYSTSDWGFQWRSWLVRSARICLPIFWGRFLTPLPYEVKMTVAVGAPVPYPADVAYNEQGMPSLESIDLYHAAYIKALKQLFEDNKAAAGYPADRQLDILEVR